MHLGRTNLVPQYSLVAEWLESSLAEKVLGNCEEQVEHKPEMCLCGYKGQRCSLLGYFLLSNARNRNNRQGQP